MTATSANSFRRNAGFTLIELLVSLALVSALSAFLLGAFDLTKRAWIASRAADAREQPDVAAARLADMLSKAAPAAALDENRLARVLFEGTADALTFVMASEGYAFPGGLAQIRIGLGEAKPGEQALFLTAGVFRANRRLIQNADPVALLRNIRGVSMAYFGSIEPGAPPAWTPVWTNRGRLPLMVSLHVVLAETSRDLIIVAQIRAAQN